MAHIQLQLQFWHCALLCHRLRRHFGDINKGLSYYWRNKLFWHLSRSFHIIDGVYLHTAAPVAPAVPWYMQHTITSKIWLQENLHTSASTWASVCKASVNFLFVIESGLLTGQRWLLSNAFVTSSTWTEDIFSSSLSQIASTNAKEILIALFLCIIAWFTGWFSNTIVIILLLSADQS